MGLNPFLKPAKPSGKATQFASKETFFLRVGGTLVADPEGLEAGDCLAVSRREDAEVGDLVVWGTPSQTALALARVAEDLSLLPVAGFPAPSGKVPGEAVSGVVVGRLRFLKS
jgi:hypothetical protein